MLQLGKRRWLTGVFLLCAAVFVVSAVMLLRSYLQSAKEQNTFRVLSAQVERDALELGRSQTPPVVVIKPTYSPAVTAALQEPPAILPQLVELYAQNADLGGWVRIEDTVLDYPVMYTPEDPEKYLRLAFDETASSGGVPFVGEGTTLYPRSDNLIVYGHHMRKGTMFATLLKYKDSDFWREHPTISFSTLYEEGEYAIVAVFQTDIYQAADLRCYDFIDAKDEADFDAYIAGIRKASLYDTGVDVAYGDALLTLSTCAYHTDEGRFVVVARKKAEPIS